VATPRFSQDEIWASVCKLQGQQIASLTGRSGHQVASVDQAGKRYEVEYDSGKRIEVSSDELYALYRELYARGSLTNQYMKVNARPVLGWSSWNAPGSAMFAILPRIDDAIGVEGGSLRIRGVVRGRAAEGQREGPIDPALATVIEAWDRLPEAVRAGIMEMVKAASGK
jgi:hypothetical protein